MSTIMIKLNAVLWAGCICHVLRFVCKLTAICIAGAAALKCPSMSTPGVKFIPSQPTSDIPVPLWWTRAAGEDPSLRLTLSLVPFSELPSVFPHNILASSVR